MRTIRASELGRFCYCQRAWWYQRQGFESENKRALSEGTHLHHAHARELKLVTVFKWLAVLFLLIGLFLILKGSF